MDFGGLRVGDAGHDKERAEQSEAGESAAFGMDVGYEGVEHGGLSSESAWMTAVEGAFCGTRERVPFRS